MKLVADEGVDKPIVDHLRFLGHEVIYIAEESPAGASILLVTNMKNQSEMIG